MSAILVTGGAGFIGSNLLRKLRERWPTRKIVSLDALTYCGNLDNLSAFRDDANHVFVKGDICDQEVVSGVFSQHDIRKVFHLAAETHVDRSIVGPLAFIETNVRGTTVLLQQATKAWKNIDNPRFHHVSTDEVYGTLPATGLFSETTPYAPNSPYSASKAASDHLVRAWHATYDLPVVLSNATNNYGPYQFPEKLIPVVISRALKGEPIPIYGQGQNVRDWLFVEDHCDALMCVMESGVNGETYCVGGNCEMTNIDLVKTVLDCLDVSMKRKPGTSQSLISFVEDRPGHDFRYAMDTTKISSDLGWLPQTEIKKGLARTVEWYLANGEWLERARNRDQRRFEKDWYSNR